MNIHLPDILMFTRGTRFWHTAIYSNIFPWFLGSTMVYLPATWVTPTAVPAWPPAWTSRPRAPWATLWRGPRKRRPLSRTSTSTSMRRISFQAMKRCQKGCVWCVSWGIWMIYMDLAKNVHFIIGTNWKKIRDLPAFSGHFQGSK